jgi:2,4-dienoyl-CoA reductase-like NADH-dependent reductase (Old Yellow Enzyme family)
VQHLGARAVGGAGLVAVEQLAVAPEGRMTPVCAGLWNDAQAEALGRVTAFVKAHGAVPGVQRGHSGRKGRLRKRWEGYTQLEADTRLAGKRSARPTSPMAAASRAPPGR